MKAFLNRNVVFLSFISLCNDIATDMIYPLLPLFITTVGGTAKILGVIEGFAETVASMLKLFGGYISDKIRKRKALAFTGYFLSNGFRPLYYFAASWVPIFAVRFLDRIGKGIRTAPRDALIADSTPPEDRAKAFSFHRSLDNLGALFGPLCAMAVLAFFQDNIRMVFLFSVIPGALAVVLFLFVKETKDDGTSDVPKQTWSVKELFAFSVFPPQLKLFIIAVVIFTLGNSSDAFMILRLKQAGVQPVYIPLLWGLFSLVKSLGNYPAGVVADRIGKKRVIMTGWLVYGAIYLLLGYVTSKTAVITTFLVYGLYYSLTEGAERAFIADVVGADVRGRAYGMYNFAIGISALPASLLFGFIWDKVSYQAAFFTGAAFSILASVMFVIMVGVRNEHTQQRSTGA